MPPNGNVGRESFLHRKLNATLRYCKKIKGKIHYWGTDRKQALERYRDQATYLHGYQGSTARPNGGVTLKELCDLHAVPAFESPCGRAHCETLQ